MPSPATATAWRDLAGSLIAGVDEAGRGPLAGPVVAAAVILDPARPVTGLADSKQLTAAQRAALAPQIKAAALAWAIGSADHQEIDRLNILQATLLAMCRALRALSLSPTHVQIDGNRLPDLTALPFVCTAEAIVRGDATHAAISAASILAKTSRDSLMEQMDARYPLYGFAGHKGYPTRAHLQQLQVHGPCAIHRRSFAPVKLLFSPRV